MRRVILMLGLLVCALVFTRGSMAEAKSEQSLLQVKILSVKEIGGSFTKDGRTIYFETRKGAPNPDDDPDAPLFELDIRIMDENHIPFVVQIAGHRPIDEKWNEEQKSFENIPINREERTAFFYVV